MQNTCRVREMQAVILCSVSASSIPHPESDTQIHRHRTPASHSCTAPDPNKPSPRNEAAKAILAKIFPASSSSGASSVVPPKKKPATSSNPKKAAQIRQVELMKMRHRALPADPKDQNRNVPIGERLHIKITAENKDEEKPFWFQKVRWKDNMLETAELIYDN